MLNRLLFLSCLILLASVQSVWAELSLLPDRRKPQFQKDPGYYVFPSPFSVPGVGEGIAVVGLGMNVWDSYTDLFGFVLTGGLEGAGIGIIDVHLIPQTLILDINSEDLSNVTVPSFSKRGMKTDKHDFTYIEFSDQRFVGARLTSTFLDRRLEFYGGGYSMYSQLEKILNEQGESILDIDNRPSFRKNVYALGVRTDMTDDYADPRRGLRLDVSRWWSPPGAQQEPDFFLMEYGATAYLPLGRRSTWAFNYFRSDAHVVRKGETDRGVIAGEEGLDCASLADAGERAECEQVIDNVVAENTYGTVSSLGGPSRLRSYPHDRFSGAHAVFYGTELRWTLTEEARPFNIFIAKDIRTLLQVAAFYEMGSIADRRDELGDIYRASYGAGFRMVTASGIVLRADAATGREGMEITIIFGYPWETF
jgi:outer membrane protein assembly factor BamA